MFPTDVVIADATPVNVTYSQVSLDGGKSMRKDATRSLGEPRSLTISHNVSGSGMSAKDRHLVRLDRVEEDTGSDDLSTISGSVYLVIEAPRRIVTATMIKDMITQMINFLETSGYQDKILNSEP